MRLVIKPLAEQDLEVISDYIARDNPAQAVAFVGELREKCRRIADNPLGYRERPELVLRLPNSDALRPLVSRSLRGHSIKTLLGRRGTSVVGV